MAKRTSSIDTLGTKVDTLLQSVSVMNIAVVKQQLPIMIQQVKAAAGLVGDKDMEMILNEESNRLQLVKDNLDQVYDLIESRRTAIESKESKRVKQKRLVGGASE